MLALNLYMVLAISCCYVEGCVTVCVLVLMLCCACLVCVSVGRLRGESQAAVHGYRFSHPGDSHR